MSNSNLPEKQLETKTMLGKFIQDLATIQLPEVIERNLIRSVSKLMTGFVEIPVAYLHEFKRRIERETEAKDLISRANAEDVVEFNRKDQEFIASSANYYSIKQFKEAGNRRAVLEKAINELRNKAISEDAIEEIDEDWLARFAKIANDVSKEDVQLILAKILAGEISKPGSFSTMTLKVLERMDRRAADEFIHLKSHISFLTDDFGILLLATTQYRPYMYGRKLAPEEIVKVASLNVYPSLQEFPLMIDLGILRPMIATKEVLFKHFEEFHIGSTLVNIKPANEINIWERQKNKTKDFKCLELTTAGEELLSLIELKPVSEKFFEALSSSLAEKTGFKLIRPLEH